MAASDSVNTRHLDGQTNLLVEIGSRDVSGVQKLLANSLIDPNQTSSLGHTPLSKAIMKGNRKIFQLLLDHPRTETNQLDRQCLTPIQKACFCGRFEYVKLLIIHPGTRLHYSDIFGHGFLWWAIDRRLYEAIELFLLLRVNMEAVLDSRWSPCRISRERTDFLQHVGAYLVRWHRKLTLEQLCWLACMRHRIDTRTILPSLVFNKNVEWFLTMDTGLKYSYRSRSREWLNALSSSAIAKVFVKQ